MLTTRELKPFKYTAASKKAVCVRTSSFAKHSAALKCVNFCHKRIIAGRDPMVSCRGFNIYQCKRVTAREY